MTVLAGQRSPPEAAQCNGLERLGLSAEQLEALARQGFLATEDRGEKTPLYKLRFRFAGRQIVKYVGRNPVVVAAIRRDMITLQQEHRQARELRKLAEEAQATLLRTKQRLRPFLEAAGMRFHGYAVRRTRVKLEK